jgi:DNA polymerase-3 subunit gamma/tau
VADNKGKQDYLVLARKYRPRTFEDVIGQDALVKTLKNAIESGRLHHAYVLQGIRGTGKTTTARLLAKVLNCENGPAISWAEDDKGCEAIENGIHVDVLEFDAASHTGVDDIRSLFEGVNYAPVQGHYKVYIIDEVHMLSKQAFNALLKTLEEPPERVKFIFATTEVNKIPVTVLSRCQRFDLKRISAEDLSGLYISILEKEKVSFDPSAVMQIAKAADGSARDGLSLLDQAIALSAGSEVTLDIVNGMLGMADRARAYDLFESLMTGDMSHMLEKLNNMYETGYDPLMIVNDLLSVAHLITKLKTVPNLANSSTLSELEKTRGNEFSQKLGLENLSRAYQMLLTVLAEAKLAPRPFEVVEMGLIRVTHMAPMPAMSTLINMAKGVGNSTAKKPLEGEQAKIKTPISPKKPVQQQASKVVQKKENQEQVTTGIENLTWRQLVENLKANYTALTGSLETQIRADSISSSHIKLQYIKGLRTEKELQNQLSEALQKTYGKRFQISLNGESTEETLAETYAREAEERKLRALKLPDIQKILDAFPGSEVLKVNNINK